MIKPIITDTFFLAQPSLEATKDDLPLGQDLRDTLAFHRESCVGMAANMIGVKKRAIIISMGFVDLVMFNPVLLEKAGAYETEESCLSLTGSRLTTRYKEITISYRDEKWMAKTLTLRDFPAQIVQHELDHLEGVVI
ncbi:MULTISPECIES: peptide deformylase [Streptococcus]|uniref:Peptide deformylase n=1 Tax=Streptococcus caledonicus TaxID=2614158 RepID=A0ABW0UCD5_9STRE|nr:peptide deformylase [Streptococcus sp. S784/96/1]